jgi:hypothetical protein
VDSLLLQVKPVLGLADAVDQSLRLYPNPAVSQVSIQGDESWEFRSLTDVWGRSYVLSPLGINSWDVSRLSPGIYWLTLHANNQRVTLQLIKQ